MDLVTLDTYFAKKPVFRIVFSIFSALNPVKEFGFIQVLKCLPKFASNLAVIVLELTKLGIS